MALPIVKFAFPIGDAGMMSEKEMGGRKIGMKKLLLLLPLTLMLSGCLLEADVENLMSPPKLSREQMDVYAALTAVTGSKIKLHYPAGGEYRSPFIFWDLDGDRDEEALVFYYPEGSGANVRINVLEQENGAWRSVYDISGYSGQVESVGFLSLSGAVGTDFVVGWQMYSLDDNIFTLYEYQDSRLTDLYSDGFTRLLTVPGDSHDRLAVIQRSRAMKQASLRLLDRRDGEVVTVMETALSPDTETYLQLAQGKTQDGLTAFFIDGQRSDGKTATQTVCIRGGELQNLSYNPEEGLDLMVATQRSESIFCQDIDGDGVTEIPVPTLVPGYEDYSEEEQRFLVSWCVIEEGRYREKSRTFFNSKDGYYFQIPETWGDQFTIYYDESLDEYVFMQHLVGGLSKNRTFMKLRTCRQGDDRNRVGLENYARVGSRGMKEYYAYLAGRQDEAEIYVSKSLFNASFSILE